MTLKKILGRFLLLGLVLTQGGMASQHLKKAYHSLSAGSMSLVPRVASPSKFSQTSTIINTTKLDPILLFSAVPVGTNPDIPKNGQDSQTVNDLINSGMMGDLLSFLAQPSFLGSCYGTNLGLTLIPAGLVICSLNKNIPYKNRIGCLSIALGSGAIFLSPATPLLKYGLATTAGGVALATTVVAASVIGLLYIGLIMSGFGK